MRGVPACPLTALTPDRDLSLAKSNGNGTIMQRIEIGARREERRAGHEETRGLSREAFYRAVVRLESRREQRRREFEKALQKMVYKHLMKRHLHEHEALAAHARKLMEKVAEANKI